MIYCYLHNNCTCTRPDPWAKTSSFGNVRALFCNARWMLKGEYWIWLAFSPDNISADQSQNNNNNNKNKKKHVRRWDTRTWHCSILVPLLHLTLPMEGFPRDKIRKILHGGQRYKWKRNIAERFNRLSRVHERYSLRDDRQICDSKDLNVM